MRSTRMIATCAVLGAMTVAGCGSSDGDSNSAPAASAPATATTASTATPAPAAGDVVEVGMKNIAFDPKAVTVKAGQKIVWTNNEGVDHNVVATSGADFKSDLFGEGKTFDYTATKAGTIEYECTIHPGMVGTITVQ